MDRWVHITTVIERPLTGYSLFNGFFPYIYRINGVYVHPYDIIATITSAYSPFTSLGLFLSMKIHDYVWVPAVKTSFFPPNQG